MTPTTDIDSRREVRGRRFVVWQPDLLSEAIATESRCLAYRLASTGVHPSDRVAMMMANYAKFEGIKFAIARVGAIAVPSNSACEETVQLAVDKIVSAHLNQS